MDKFVSSSVQYDVYSKKVRVVPLMLYVVNK